MVTTQITRVAELDFTDTKITFAGISNQSLVKSYWLFTFMGSPTLSSLNSSILPGLVRHFGPARWAVKQTAFAHFCGGETITDCESTIARLAQQRVGTILDYSVEGEKNESSYDATTHELLRAIEKTGQDSRIPFAVFKMSGLVNPHLLTKKQAGALLLPDEEAKYGHFLARLTRIFDLAAIAKVRVFIDAEESWFQGEIDALALGLMEKYNTTFPVVWNTYQLYLIHNEALFKAHLETALKKGFKLGAKLVRGAYLEKEAAYAKSNGSKTLANPTKQATDAMYDRVAALALHNLETVNFCLGTHNEESCRQIATAMLEAKIDENDKRVWFAQLLGMSDNLSNVLAASGYNVAKYVPYGPVEAVIPYLLRRANENTSVAGQTTRELKLIKAEIKRRGTSKLSMF